MPKNTFLGFFTPAPAGSTPVYAGDAAPDVVAAFGIRREPTKAERIAAKKAAAPRIPAYQVAGRLEGIRNAVNRGQTVVFTNRLTGIVKKVNAWAPRADGELRCCYSSGKSNYVDPTRSAYDVTTSVTNTVRL